MKKLIIILILLIAVTSDVYAFNWDKFERKAYTVLEFTYVGVVGMDVGTTIAANRLSMRERNLIARPFLEESEGLFIAGVVVYCGGTTFGMRKLRGLGDRRKGYKEKGAKAISWVVLGAAVIYHSIMINSNLEHFSSFF